MTLRFSRNYTAHHKLLMEQHNKIQVLIDNKCKIPLEMLKEYNTHREYVKKLAKTEKSLLYSKQVFKSQ